VRALHLVAGVAVVAGLIALETPRLQRYPPPPSSVRVESYAIGGTAVAAGVALAAFVVLRTGGGRRALRRLAGVLTAAAVLPALSATATAAYFGQTVWTLPALVVAIGFVGLGGFLLRRE
jgi:hypothetical protein